MTTVYLADHSALLAIPAFAPALVVVGVVIWIARRDRRNGDDGEHHEGDDEATDGTRLPSDRSPSADGAP